MWYRIIISSILIFLSAFCLTAQDTVSVLPVVHVNADKKLNKFNQATPLQQLDQQTLQRLYTPTIGDAAKYFSGVLIKDYGGVGGLKTISVRSLGASYTGIVYDGLPVSDMQSGQIDLSKFSTSFVRKLELLTITSVDSLLPARIAAFASALLIATKATAEKNDWSLGYSLGSFGLHEYNGSVVRQLTNTIVASAVVSHFNSHGDYPFVVDNGNLSYKTRRTNSRSLATQAEVNLHANLKDSSSLVIKIGLYNSDRGLPGAIIFYNERSVQQLSNTDGAIQINYNKKISSTIDLIAHAKYSNAYTKYQDPDFLNNQGGLDNRFRKLEFYGGAGARYQITPLFMTELSSDIAYSKLDANLPQFKQPTRLSNWTQMAVSFSNNDWKVSASALSTYQHDEVDNNNSITAFHKFSPAAHISYQLSPFLLLRSSYQFIFRTPSFNELYYTLIGNRNLQPEKSRQSNLGLSYARSFLKNIRQLGASIDLYTINTRDKIIAIPARNLFAWTMLNFGKVKSRGLDVTAEAATRSFFFRLAYSYQHATDRSDKTSATYNDRIPYTPDHSGSAIVTYNYLKYNLSYSSIFLGSRYSLGANDPGNKVAGWMTADMSASTTFLTKLKFNVTTKLELTNLFNQQYDIVRYYPMPGRSIRCSFLINHI